MSSAIRCAMRLVCVAVVVFSTRSPVTGDMFVVDEMSDEFGNVGDFTSIFGNDPKSSPGRVEEIINMGNAGQPDAQSGSLDAGVLWQLFDDRGIGSLRSLTLSLGINESGPLGTNWVDANHILLEIEDPNNLGSNIFSADLDSSGDHTVRVFNYAQGANTAELQMRIALGFDFMTIFSANSTEQIHLSVNVSNRSSGFEIFFFDSDVNIPEPGSSFVICLAAGLTGLLSRRKRRFNRR